MKQFTKLPLKWGQKSQTIYTVGLTLLLLAVLSACDATAFTPAGTVPAADVSAAQAATTESPTAATSTLTTTLTMTATPSITATTLLTTPVMDGTPVATGTITTTSGLLPTITVTTTAMTPVATETTPTVVPTPALGITATAAATPAAAVAEPTAGNALFVDIPPLDTDMTDLTIGEIISTAEGFSTLADALDQTNLMPLLNGPGPVTFFAPTDNAFVNYPAGAIDELMANPAILVDLLQYHMIVDNSPIAQLAELGSAVTYLGEPLAITIDADGAYYVNDVVIVQTDIQAANGVIHVINGLLVPPSATGIISSRTVNPQAESDTGARDMTLEQLAAADTSGQTIMEIISSIEGFNTLTAAVNAAGLNDALNTGGPITLLAPTNGAFAEIPDFDLEVLLNTAPDELVNLLQYHIILGGVTAADLGQLGTVLTATGAPVTATVDSDGVIMLNDGAATVYMANIEASNGIIHAISAVLTPPAQ